MPCHWGVQARFLPWTALRPRSLARCSSELTLFMRSPTKSDVRLRSSPEVPLFERHPEGMRANHRSASFPCRQSPVPLPKSSNPRRCRASRWPCGLWDPGGHHLPVRREVAGSESSDHNYCSNLMLVIARESCFLSASFDVPSLHVTKWLPRQATPALQAAMSVQALYKL